MIPSLPEHGEQLKTKITAETRMRFQKTPGNLKMGKGKVFTVFNPAIQYLSLVYKGSVKGNGISLMHIESNKVTFSENVITGYIKSGNTSTDPSYIFASNVFNSARGVWYLRKLKSSWTLDV